MKKLFLIITTTVLLSVQSFAQDKGYIAISGGPSIPVGQFGSSDESNKNAGYATLGGILDLSFAYKLRKNFQICALLRGQSNPFDVQAAADAAAKQYPNFRFTVESDNWTLWQAMIGLSGSFPFSEKLSFEPKGMIGLLNANSPWITITMPVQGGNVQTTQASASSLGVSYLFGAGFKYNVGSKICLLLNIDYVGSKAEYKDVPITNNFGGGSSTTSFTQSFGTVNFGFGVGYRL